MESEVDAVIGKKWNLNEANAASPREWAEFLYGTTRNFKAVDDKGTYSVFTGLRVEHFHLHYEPQKVTVAMIPSHRWFVRVMADRTEYECWEDFTTFVISVDEDTRVYHQQGASLHPVSAYAYEIAALNSAMVRGNVISGIDLTLQYPQGGGFERLQRQWDKIGIPYAISGRDLIPLI